jgi:C-terminal processing protease CtpA/Prc
MKNIKFGVFCLGLAVATAGAVSTIAAQDRDGRPSTRERRPMVDIHSLRTGGSELGAMVSDLDPSTRQSSQADSGSLRAGVVVNEVNAGSPAEQAGLKAGDIVLDYDGERVRSARQFTRLVRETPEGRPVAIGIVRDGKKQTVNATPEAGRMTWNVGPDVDRALREAERGMRGFRFDVPAPYFDFRYDDRDRDNREPRRFEYRLPQEFRFPAPGSRFPNSRCRLGVSVQSITPELAEFFGAKNGGALVSSVSRDSAAATAGIKAGDVIVSINGKAVSYTGDLMDTLGDITSDATIVVLRDKKEVTLKATLDR